MGDTVITLARLDKENVSSHKAQMPFYMTGSFVGNDTDNHSFKIDSVGKSKFTIAVDNATDKTVTITVFGMHSSTAEVGDTGVFPIAAAGFAVTTGTIGYGTNSDIFPWYLIRAKFADTPTDSPSEEVTLYISFSAY